MEAIDIIDLAREIFQKPVQPPNTIQLEFSDPDEPVIDATKFLFEQLLMVFTEGMKQLFGDNRGKVDLGKLQPTDFLKVREYFHSFGFDIFYKMSKLDENPPHTTSNSASKLSDRYLNLKTEQMRYTVWFDVYVS